uniref:Uncharacterized protein n=1 Tax=Clytia hemisphaerica TaxID=252671 RepID=A0A7M5VGC9_9CNID
MSKPLSESEVNLLEQSLGWKDEWLDDHEKIVSLSDERVPMFTIQILFLLRKILPSTTALFKILCLLVPQQGFCLPTDARALARKMKKLNTERTSLLKSKGGKEKLEVIHSGSFFEWLKKHKAPTVSSTCPSKTSEQLQREEDFQNQKQKLELLLEEEKSKSRRLGDLIKEEKSTSELSAKTIDNLKGDKVHLNKVIGGLKSSIAKYQSVIAAQKLNSAQQSFKGCNHDTGLGFITITRFCEGEPRIFEGIKYTKDLASMTFKSNNQPAIFTAISSKHSNSTLCDKQLNNRVSFLFKLLCLLSGCAPNVFLGRECDVQELSVLFAKFLKKYGNLFFSDFVLPSDFFPKLSPAQAVDVKSLLRLSMDAFRKLRIVLKKCLGFNIFPSEGKMRDMQSQLLTYLKKADVNVSTQTLVKVGQEKKHGNVYVLRCRDLSGYMENVLKEYKLKAGFGPDDAQKRVDLLFSGDKGGGLVKFYFEVICGQTKLSVYDVHVFSMYEGSDCYENLHTVFEPFQVEIRRIQEDDFRLDGHPVKVLLGGDFHFLDAVLGHQGSSATFPSSKWDVSLSHLREHGSRPHTPENCVDIQFRNVDDVNANYSANLALNGQSCELRKTGKFHCCFFGPMIFPIKTLENVVPPVLHIMLGIVLKLFNLLLDRSRDLDSSKVGSPAHIENMRQKEKAEEEARVTMEALDKKRRELGKELVDLYSWRERFDAVLAGNIKELHSIAKAFDNSCSTKNPKFEKCTGIKCFLSCYDSDVFWVACDVCKCWKHCMCELIPSSEQAYYSNEVDSKYTCLTCRGKDVDDISDLFKDVINKIVCRQESAEASFQRSSHTLAMLEEETVKTMGPIEIDLHRRLNEINVDRQAFHGEVFVGNHCKIVLAKHKYLCECLDGDKVGTQIEAVLEIFAKLVPLIFTKKDLDEEEITELTNLCNEYGRVFPKSFPAENLTVKMHSLIFSVPRFVSIHKTIGRYSEEEGESLHNLINQELRRVCSIRCKPLKLKLVLEGAALRAKADRTLLKPISRKCQSCHKGFYLQGVCQSCNAKR